MSDAAGFWIIATFALGALAVIFLLIIAAIWFFAKKEGRYMISRGTFAKGIDLLIWNPQSNKLELKVLEWMGNIWKTGKEGMMVGLDLISDPSTEADKTYNKMLRNASNWAGSNRPVVMATPTMSTILNPAFIAAANKGEAFTDDTVSDGLLGKLKHWWGKPARKKRIPIPNPEPKTLIQHYENWAILHGIEVVTYLECIKPAELKKYLKDIGPKNMRDSFIKGVEAQKLANTKPPNERMPVPGAWIWLIIMAIALIAGFYLLQSGALDGIL